MVDCLPSDGLIIDVGKGDLGSSALSRAQERNIDVIRGNITESMGGYLAAMAQTEELILHRLGKAVVADGTVIISGGLLGQEGEIVVDDYKHPAAIYGVADGRGNLKPQLGSDDLRRIEILREMHSIP